MTEISNRALFSTVLLSIVLTLVNCGNQNLRGSMAKSADGNTYLNVIDDNGGNCGPIIVDGKVWSHRIGEPGLISPGRHKIECGGWIEFEIPKGVIFSFDYWGP